MALVNSGLGGAAGYGEGVFSSSTKAAGDTIDGSIEVDISSVFGSAGLKFFDTSYSSIYINSNGLISFGSPDTSYSGNDLSDLANPSIAPFWADHNVDNGGEIYWDLDPASGKVTITWDNVAPYNGTGTNTYQVVLEDTGNGNIEIEFVYEDIDWFHSGGSSAVTGITDGDSNHYPMDGSGRPNELKNYEQNDFGGGDEEGTYKVPFEDGVPNFQNGTVDGSAGDDSFSITVPGIDLQGDGVTNAADKVLAGAGNDIIDAGDGEDTLHGGSGADTLLGGAGSDEIYGDGILGDQPSPTTIIDASNFGDTTSGFRVTGRNVENGTLTSASADNVATTMGGFGAGGAVSDSDSGVTQQTGFDLASGTSEQLIVDFDETVSEASFSFSVLYSADYGEKAHWAIFDEGRLVAESDFTESNPGGGSGTIDLSGYGSFDQIVFTGLPQSDGSDGSDFLITEISFEKPDADAIYDDLIAGGDGQDAIYGGFGADTISGDAGDDKISGEDGDDRIDAGIGDDSVSGGEGSDTIVGGAGSDLIDGGQGDDFLKTGQGQDTAIGGDGNDTLMNAAGDDSLVGGTGDDLIVASQGRDTLEGGEGQDTLMGGTDGDKLEGGAGNDLLMGDLAGVTFNDAGADGLGLASKITDFPSTQLSYEITFSSTEMNGSTPLGSYAVSDQANELNLIVGPKGEIEVNLNGLYLGTGVDASILFDGNVHTVAFTWYSSDGTINLFLDGASAYSGTLGAGRVLDGNGTFALGQEQDALGGGFDKLQQFEGTVYGVRLYDDVRTASEIADTVHAPVADTSDPNLLANWVADPNSATFTDQTGSYPMAMSGDVSSTWSEGDDKLLGGDGADTIHGGGGDDYIEGGLGDDFLTTGLGNDTLIGGEGDDTLMNSDGDDSLDGGAGDDSIVATGGEDTLRGGAGADTMKGGDDADTFIIEDGFGNDSITGGEGVTDLTDIDSDTIDGGALSGNITVSFTGDEAGTITDGTDTITFTEVENVFTGSGDDVLDASNDSAGVGLFGGAGTDTITGGSGADYSDGGNDADTFIIEDSFGNDTIGGGEGGIDSDTIDLSAMTGSVTVTYSGDEAGTITDGTDTITFTEIERIILTDQNDSVNATSDSAGIDIDAGVGDDTITDGSGDDRILGGSGNDYIAANDGSDTLEGGAGNDEIEGGDGGDNIDGGTGNDFLAGYDVNGLGSGNTGTPTDGWDDGASDTIQGGTGDDTILGGGGADSLSGGDDSDTLIIHDAFGNDTIIGGDGGTDDDTIDLTHVTGPVTVTYSGDEKGTITDGSDTITFSGIERIITTDQDDVVDASADNIGVVISAGDGADSITDGSGNDSIDGGDGDDSIAANDGNDTIAGGAGGDDIEGGDGSDSIDGGSGDDFIAGYDVSNLWANNTAAPSDAKDDDAADTLVGGTGADTLLGGGGADSLSGGDDADTFIIHDDFGNDTIIGGEGGTDDDVIDFSNMTGPVKVTYSGDEQGTITDGSDTINFSEIERIVLTDHNDSIDAMSDATGSMIDGADGDDSIIGSQGNDTIFGGAGKDTISDGLGDDSVDAGDGDDVIGGWHGNDTFDGGDGNDSIEGGDGADSILGGSGSDLLIGYDGANMGSGSTSVGADDGASDTIDGGSGADTIAGGKGADSLSGGDDADTFVFQDNFGNDTIVGGEGGSDVDTIDLSAMTGPVTVTYSDHESGTITDGFDTINFSEIENLILTDHADSVDATAVWDGEFGDRPGINLDAGAGNDTIEGGRGGDTVDGGSGDDAIDADYGDDSVTGGSGNDTLIGSTGNDTLLGGADNDSIDGGVEGDVLSGGTGDDTLTGGDGDDVFTYSAGDGADTITDFNFGNSGTLGDGDNSNNDFIDLSGFYDNIGELHADFDDDGVLNQSNSTDNGGDVDYSNNDQFASGDGITFQGADQNSFAADNTNVVCFTKGTLILTPSGPKRIEDLCLGDLVVTRDNGPQPLIWKGMRRLGKGTLSRQPQLLPVQIAPDLVGAEKRLLVSPQHGVLIRDPAGEEVLVRAKHLARMHGGKARVLNGCRNVTYIHLMFEAHQIIFANGAATESFFPGPMAMAALDAGPLAELQSLFPGLGRTDAIRAYGMTARAFVPPGSLPGNLRELVVTT